MSQISLRLPDSSVMRLYVARGFRLWAIVRLAIALVPLLAGEAEPRDILQWNPGGAIGTLCACALLGFLDTRRRGERALLANLGIHDRELVAMFVAPAAVGEMLLALVLPS